MAVEASIVCTWDTNRGEETKIKFHNFDNLSQIAKLDFLKDVIGELTELYKGTDLFPRPAKHDFLNQNNGVQS